MLYSLGDNGVFKVFDAKSGELRYTQRLGSGLTGFTASPIAIGSKILFASEEGEVYVVKAGAQFELLSKNSMGEMEVGFAGGVRGCAVLSDARSRGGDRRIGEREIIGPIAFARGTADQVRYYLSAAGPARAADTASHALSRDGSPRSDAAPDPAAAHFFGADRSALWSQSHRRDG